MSGENQSGNPPATNHTDAWTRFEQLLAKKKRNYSEVAKELGPKPGLRLIRITGDAVRSIFVEAAETDIEDAGQRFIDYLFARLPEDAAIKDLDGALVRMVPASNDDGSGTFHDQYAIVIASREWEPIEEGGLIPWLGHLHLLPARR